MERQCQDCGITFDDSTDVSVCPHFIGQRYINPPAASTLSVVDELVAYEIQELTYLMSLFYVKES